MTAQLIDGKAIAKKVRAEVQEAASAFAARHGRKPALDVVLVGDDPASLIYVRNKERACAAVGIRGTVHHLPASSALPDVLGLVQELNADPAVDGILVQTPLPGALDSALVSAAVAPSKDVDALTIESAGLLLHGRPGLRPPTPAGCIRLLTEIGCTLRGKRALVVGRSSLVGKPTAHLLLEGDASVTIAHSRSHDLRALVAEAEIVIAAAGRPGLIAGAWIRTGAVVIDVANNRTSDGRVCGDVEFEEARERASWITPVPGGVGPMTVAMLLHNTVEAARERCQTASDPRVETKPAQPPR
jgi:methylenetetrahydrofolate dehydrogenase (NADP+)/methenyltetrahydrofolate cyclohydrolase